MSFDLEWDKLDASLSSKLIDALNRQLANTIRPSFIGPIEVTSFDFGSTSPDIELADLRDIYRDFLEDDLEDDEDDDEPQKVSQLDEEDEDYEWVSRKAIRGKSIGEDGPAYHLLPPHLRYGRGAGIDMFSSTPALRAPGDIWSPAFTSLVDLRPTYPTPSFYASARSTAPPTPLRSRSDAGEGSPSPGDAQDTQSDSSSLSPSPPAAQANAAAHPNLQLHLHITWHSNMRLTLTTSLLINYPSPMFMSLPIKLSVTGLLFNGEVVVAYEGERRRIHLCIVDELDPYSPLAGDRPKRDTPSSGSTPPDTDDYTPGSAAGTSRASKPLPIGQRLLPSIFIESEIGQADKHVLKNVTRVERFIQDVIRKTIEEELVFPNFHTVIIGEAAS